MSFILDALKKSEAERLRKDAPGIASIPERARQKPSTKWIWLVLALVTLNLAVLAVLMLRVEQESAPVEVPVAMTNTEARGTPAVPSSTTTATIERNEPPVANIESETVIDEPFAAPIVNPPAATETMTEPQSEAVNSDLETFNDLRAKGVLVLPDMHLDIHVYSANAADRFVFVNMSKYTENSTLTEGPSVQEITPDGVVLNYQGTAFLLPRE